jgi:branched-chain amino acid aminotransferase
MKKNNHIDPSKGRVVYMNGKYVPESEAKISIFDSALMFGDMVFEMTRSFNKKQFRLKEHLDRLYVGLKILRIPEPMSKKELEKKCHEVVEINEPMFSKNDEHRIMINISRGPLGIYASIFDGKIEPTLVIADIPLRLSVAGFSKFYDEGINCVIPSQRSIPATLMDPKIKNRSRMWYQVANIEVSQYEGKNNWALLIDPDGYITEGTGDNFFIIKDKKIISPEGRNILRGISRDYTKQISEELGYEYIEKNIEPYDVHRADEAFITGTPFCIMPVTSLNSIPIGTGTFGEITRKLLDKWSKNLNVDIEKQIRDWDKVNSTTPNAPTPYQFKTKI